jgi:hypothetical protein
MCLALGAPVAAQPACLSIEPVGPEVDLSDEDTTQRRNAAIAYNSADDQFMVAWFDLRNQPTSGNDIFAQVMDAALDRVGENAPVSVKNDAQIDPAITYSPVANEYFVAWRTQEAGFFNNARGRRVHADGTFPQADVFVSNGGLEGSLAYNSIEDQFMFEGRGSGIRGRLIDAGADPTGADLTLSNNGAPAPCGQVTYDVNSNRWLATWRNQVDEDLRGALYNFDGSVFKAEFVISDQFPSSGRAASNAFDTVADRFLVVYGQFQGPKVLGRFVDAGGDLLGEEFDIFTGGGNQINPVLAYSSVANVFLLAHFEGNTIHVRLLDLNGNVVGDPIMLGAGTAADRPSMAENTSSGEIVVAWADDRNLGEGQQDIFAGRVQITSGDPGDFNGDGAKNILDFVAFQGAFVAQDPAADCDGNGAFNVLDFVCFQNLFVNGCG